MVKKYYYFDSFGFPASQELEDMMNEYVFSDIDLQNINSTSCGWFCIVWMRYMQEQPRSGSWSLRDEHKDKELGFSSFLKLFSKDTKKNEKILHELLR